MRIACEVARMGTCVRRQVGAVLVDDSNRIVSTGFNGVPPGWDHCRYGPGNDCPGRNAKPGENLDGCVSNHAEANALIWCGDPTRPKVLYCTSSPCISCTKMLLCTTVHSIIFLEEYPHTESRDLWLRHPTKLANNRIWSKFYPSTGESRSYISMP